MTFADATPETERAVFVHGGWRAGAGSSNLPAVKPIPGTLRAGGAPFAPTHWSVVLLAAESRSQAAALTHFCQAYWPPLYAFVRRRGLPPADAQDCVQGFFVHLLEANTLSRTCPEKGRLRTFLLGSLQHFMTKEYHRARALKRGGGQPVVSLEDHLAEAEAAVQASAGVVDEAAAYDQHWAAALIRRAWERLRETAAAAGKEALFDELKAFFFVGAAPTPDQGEVAARLEMPVATLHTHLHRLRGRYREALRAEVAQTVSRPAEVDGEMRYLYQVISA